MMRVGFIDPFFAEGLGGANYYHNLLGCYQKYPDPEITLVVFTSRIEQAARYQCNAIEIQPWPEKMPGLPWNLPRRATRRLLGYDPVFIKALEKQRIDLLSHRKLSGRTKINTLFWQQDFQHKVLPHFFDQAECSRRDTNVRSTQSWGNILLSSQAAAEDFRHYYPELSSVETRVLHFSGTAALNYAPHTRDELAAQYPVRTPYFFLPNQFWQHKNHGVVIDALRETRPEIRVICTGSLEDYRRPDYVPALLAKVKDAGLEERFICLGVVPYATLVSLMHHALAVIQPSLFEGWSTSVEEAKAMCKRVVLSNLDVHIEQAPERGLYFSPDSPAELAAHLKRIYAEFDPETEQSYVEKRQQLKEKAEHEWVTQYAQILKNVSQTAN